jgi:hypothetical protein
VDSQASDANAIGIYPVQWAWTKVDSESKNTDVIGIDESTGPQVSRFPLARSSLGRVLIGSRENENRGESRLSSER